MPTVTTPFGPQTVLVPSGRLLVPSSGELAPTNWLNSGAFVLVTTVRSWSPVGLLAMPLSVTVNALVTSPSPTETTSAQSCTMFGAYWPAELLICAVTALTFTARPTMVTEYLPPNCGASRMFSTLLIASRFGGPLVSHGRL